MTKKTNCIIYVVEQNLSTKPTTNNKNTVAKSHKIYTSDNTGKNARFLLIEKVVKNSDTQIKTLIINK